MSQLARPLHGEVILSLKVDKNRVLAKRALALEWGFREILEADIPEPRSGVGVIRSWDATGLRGPTIESAKIHNPHPQTFLISSGPEGPMVVSSQIGPGEGQVSLPNQRGSIDLYDYDPDEYSFSELVLCHVNRAETAGIDLRIKLPQPVAEEIFRQMIHGTVETW